MLDGSTHDSLAQIGITSDRAGQGTLDATKFQAALSADPSAVRKVFTAENGDGKKDGKDGIAVRIQDFTKVVSDETLSSRLSGYTAQVKRLDDRTADLEDLMALKEKRLKAQFAAMDAAVSRLQNQGSELAARLGGL